MVARPPLPTITLSTRASRVLPLALFPSIAGAAGVDGLDLDLTGRISSSRPATIRERADQAGVPVRAIWLPPTVGAPVSPWRQRRIVEATVGLVAGTGSRTVILDRSGRPVDRRGRTGPPVPSLLQELRAALPGDARFAIVVRPWDLDGSRRHLAELSALRRMAEEWDHDLALDLFGPIDPRWEAEAAVMRLLPRLTAIRFGPLESRPPGRGRAKMTARVLSLAVDAGFAGTIATTPQPAVLRGLWPPAIAEACAATARLIRARFAAVYEAPVPHDIYPTSRHHS
jgi:hypothetical protein